MVFLLNGLGYPRLRGSKAACSVAVLVAALSACASEPRQVRVDMFEMPDQPVRATSTAEWAELERVMAPYVAQARASYPDVRARFLAGLPSDQELLVVARLRDSANRVEQVFVSVDMIQHGSVTGHIAGEVQTVTGYANGDWYILPEAEIVDWVIIHSVHSGGSEEGNVVGKFLDEYQKAKGATRQ